MGYSISIQSFHDKQIAKFDRSIVWDIFRPRAEQCNEGWLLNYSGRYGGVLYLADDALIEGCSVMRPSKDAIEDLFEVARRVPATIGHDGVYCVLDPDVIANMPDWLLNALPAPAAVVSSVDEFLHRMSNR